MKYLKLFTFAVAFFLVACEKDDSTLTPVVEKSYIFTTSNVKTTSAYFNFDSNDTNKTTWDLKFTTEAVPTQPGAPPAVFPSIQLNRSTNVKAKIINGVTFESINVDTVSNLQADPTDSTFVIGMNCLLYAGAPTHKLNPYENRTFIIQTPTKKLKMRMLTYYNDLGSSGYFKFEYVTK